MKNVFQIFTALGAAVSEFYYFRSNGGGYSIFFVLLVSFVIGKWMARVLPTDEFKIGNWRFTLNPGNVLIGIDLIYAA